jgi:hypothetical protein
MKRVDEIKIKILGGQEHETQSSSNNTTIKKNWDSGGKNFDSIH